VGYRTRRRLGMKFVDPHSSADPDAAARKLVEIANGVEAVSTNVCVETALTVFRNRKKLEATTFTSKFDRSRWVQRLFVFRRA
jgi:hypothetical protein